MTTDTNAAGERRARTIRRSPHVIAAARDDDTVLMDVARGSYFSLDAVGSRVWELLATPTPFDQLVSTLADEYDAPHGRIVQDVDVLLDRLEAAYLIWTD